MSIKIIVVGQVGGRCREVFNKISNLHAKNAFVFALIVGNLFEDPREASDQDEEVEALLNDRVDIPLPTYFSLGSFPLPRKVVEKLESSNGELTENLYFMGKHTTIKTSEGPRIVALGGILNSSTEEYKDKFAPKYSESDAKTLKGANTADILITSEWPSGIQKGSKVTIPTEKSAPDSRQCIADLCSTLRPRYHFSTSPDIFYEREPFFHTPAPEQAADGFAITRFISLASYGNPNKQKWIYAFSIDTTTTTLPLTLPTGTTACPFTLTTTKKRSAQPSPFTRFSTDTHTPYSGNKRRKHHSSNAPPTPATCFFCLSNPSLPTHLITSISSNTYLTTAKGPLPTRKTYPTLPFPAHILLIPLAHTPTLPTPTDPDGPATIAELHRYRTALNTMLAARSTSTSTSSSSSPPRFGSVSWAISRAAGVHAHWQWLPVPAPLVAQGLAEAAFKVQAELEGYAALRTVEDDDSAANAAADAGDELHVYLWAPSAEQGGAEDGAQAIDAAGGPGSTRHLVLALPPASADPAAVRFNLQYPRLVLAKLLGLEERVNWRDCEQTVEEETEDAEAFKEAFKAWDFSLEE